MTTRTKPSFPRLRADHRLARGLHWCLTFADGAGVVSRDVGPNGWDAVDIGSVNEARVPSPYGWAVDHSLSVNRAMQATAFVSPPIATSFTLVSLATARGVNSNRRLWSGTGLTTGHGLVDNVAGELQFRINNGSNRIASGPAVPLNQWYAATGTWDGVSLRLYVDGRFAVENTPGGSSELTSYSGISVSTQGNSNSGLLRGMQIVAFASVHSRALSAQDVFELHSDPFAMFRPRQRSYFYAAAASLGGTFPAPAQVLAGVIYGPTDNLTGTLVLPAANTVLDGTMFGPASATEGTATVPPVGKVIDSETYGAGGTALTGTYAEIAASLVVLGNQYGAGGTQYTGTVRVPTAAQVLVGVNFGASDAIAGAVVLPAVGDVRTSIGYGPSSGSIGTLSLPGVGSVLSSASYGAGGTEFVGTFANVAASSVVLGVQYGANGTQFTGTVRVPTAAQVLVGVSFGASDAIAGTVALPTVGNVRSGVTFGPGSASTGTVVVPTQSQVLDGVSFDTASTGNVVLPTAGQVLNPVSFGPAGATTGTITLPSAAQVLDSITFGPGAATTGTVVLPSVGDVRDGTFFGPASTLEGTLDADIPGNYPSVGQVLVGVVFGDSNEFTGTYVEVAAADVRDGVLFGPGSSLEGTLVAGIDPPDSPLMSAVSVLCLDEQGLPASGVSVDLRVVSIPAGDTNVAYRGNKQTAISGVDGIATIEAPRGSRCQIKRGPAADWKTITIADAASTDVESIIGSP
jgi:hypothetical protein